MPDSALDKLKQIGSNAYQSVTEDNMATRYADRIGDYLKRPGQNFMPGIAGAVLGGGASALYTERKRGETPAQRAMRTVRNALIGGALGGTGAQALHFGVGDTVGAVLAERPNFDKDPNAPKGEGGDSEQPKTLMKDLSEPLWANLVGMGLGGAVARARELGHHTHKEFQNLFGSTGLSDVKVNGQTLNNIAKTPTDITQMFKAPWFRSSPYVGWVKDQMRAFREPTVSNGGKGVSSMDTLRQFILDRNSHLNTPDRIIQVNAFLKRMGVGQGKGLGGRMSRALDRGLSPSAQRVHPLSQGAGVARGVVGMGLGYAAPSLISAATRWGFGDGPSASGVVNPAFPNLGANQ